MKSEARNFEAGEDPSMVHPMVSPEKIESTLEVEELWDTNKYNWSDYTGYKMDYYSDDQTRPIKEVIEINNITRYFRWQLENKKVSLNELADLKVVEVMRRHKKELEDGTFSWEAAEADSPVLLASFKEGLSKYYHVNDIEMLDHSLFQAVYPIELINLYMGVVNRKYGTPVYDKALRFHTCLGEVFLWHHLKPDTKFHSRISTENVNIVDPLFRMRVRANNIADPVIKEKYFKGGFSLKKFAYMLLDNFFPNVTWRYIGGGQEMHRHALRLVLTMFELGLWKYTDLPELINILLMKLENLNTLEKRSYLDFETTLKGYPAFNKKLKAYFFDCKEMVASICVHIVLLINDSSFAESYHLYNPNLKVGQIDSEECWKNAYFNNVEVSNVLNRVLTTYLLNFKNESETKVKENCYRFINDFIMMITDIDNDVFYVSSKVINNSLIQYYTKSTKKPSSYTSMSLTYKKSFENLIFQIASNYGGKNKAVTDKKITSTLQEYLVSIGGITNEAEKLEYKYALAEAAIPQVLLCLISLMTDDQCPKQAETLTQLALIETCKKNLLGQVVMTNDSSMQHWQTLFSNRSLTTIILLDSIFQEDYSLLYVHRNLLTEFMNLLTSVIDKDWKIEKDVSDNTSSKYKVESWLEKFKSSLTSEEKALPLDSFITYYVYCKFLLGIFENRDANFDATFHSLNVQEHISTLFFDFFYPIIINGDFIKNLKFGEEGYYNFNITLEKMTNAQLVSFNDVNHTSEMQDDLLRSVIFEIAMLTMKLMCKCTSGFFLNWLYQEHIKPTLKDLLTNTEYIFKMPPDCFKYRGIILEFMTNFQVFPNDGLISMRQLEFKSTTGKATEGRIPANHTDHTIVNVIVDELARVDEVIIMSDSWKGRGDYSKDVKRYYFNGLFPYMYKYCKGLYYMYFKDDKVDSLHEALKKLMTKVEEVAPKFEKLGIHFKAKSESQGGVFGNLMGLNKVAPAREGKSDIQSRFKDPDEKATPNLIYIRDMLSLVISNIEGCYNQDKEFLEVFDFISNKYDRECPIVSMPEVIEPWSPETSSGSTLKSQKSTNKSAMTESQVLHTKSLASLLVERSGLNSAEHRHYVSLFETYQQKKKEALDKPPTENIFIRFLSSPASATDNIIIFVTRLVQRYFGAIFNHEEKKDENDTTTKESKTLKENKCCDLLMKTFMQSDIICSFVVFLSNSLNGCDKLRDGFFTLLKEKNTDGEDFLSLLNAVKYYLANLAQHKPFHDHEWKIAMDRYLHLAELFKNLCENNYQKFKIFFSKFKPKIGNIPSFNSANQTLFYNMYVRMETSLNGYNVWTNTSNKLEVQDRPEDFDVLIAHARVIAEMCNGPCLVNQKAIFRFRNDAWFGIIRRQIDDVNSTFYNLKSAILDYNLALLEGSDDEILQHMASNSTFQIIYDLIYESLKRLFIHCKYSNDKSGYESLCKKAVLAHQEKLAAKLKKNQEFKAKKNSNLIVDFYSESQETTSKIEISGTATNFYPDELYNPQIVSKVVMDYVKIDNYTEIFEMYVKNGKFAKHTIMEIVIKLNDFLKKCASKAASFSISLDNVHNMLIDQYDEDVPMYIREKYNAYESKGPRDNFEEKHVFYAFLIKISSEIELVEPISDYHLFTTFPLPPETFFLTDTSKAAFFDVDDFDYAAVRSLLMQNYSYLKIEMDYNWDFYRNHPFMYKISSDDSFRYLMNFIWLLGLIINVVIVIYYRRTIDGYSINSPGDVIVPIIALVIAIFSVVSLIIWIFNIYWQKVLIARKRDNQVSQLVKRNPVVKFFSLYIWRCFLKQKLPMLTLIHLAANLLGYFVDPFFYTVQLLTIVYISNTTSYVVSAITTHFDQLALTFLLAVFVMYSYSVLTANFFWDSLEVNSDLSDPEPNCTQLWECLMYVVNFGLRNGGGIAESTSSFNPYADEAKYTSKFFFDLIFFLLINIISLNIIFGIIIDTFSDMREKNESRGRIGLIKNNR